MHCRVPMCTGMYSGVYFICHLIKIQEMNNIKSLQIEQIDAQTIFNKFDAIIIAINALKLQTASTNDESLLTRQEVADLLKVSLVTVWSWTGKGILKSYRIGNKIRYKKSEILETPVATKLVGNHH